MSTKTHGQSHRTTEYVAWCNMKIRCYEKSSNRYKFYGGRGIKVCKRWFSSFENFFSDMGKKPTRHHSVERKNLNGNYSPSNCFWATPIEQANNKSNNVRYRFKGEELTIPRWAVKLRVPKYRLYRRIYMGWTPIEAFTTPPRGNK